MQDTLSFPGRRSLTQPRIRERVLLIVAGLFTLAGFIQLSWADPLALAPHLYVIGPFAWAAMFTTAHVVLNRYLPERDPLIAPIVGLLTGWGLLLVARLSRTDFPRQVIWMLIGAAAMLAVATASRELRWLRRYRYTWLVGGLALLAATFVFGVNPSGLGQELWLGFGSVFFQPSELVKLLMVVFLASYLAEKRDLQLVMRVAPGAMNLAYLAPMLAMWGVAMALLVIQQDLGAAILLFLAFLVMLYLASGKWQYLLVGGILLIVAVLIGYGLIDRVAERVNTWLNPWPRADLESYQVVQSLIGIGSGGLIGRGLGLGDPIVPAAHTDMPLAVVGEEFGLFGAIALVASYALLTLRGLRAAIRARTVFAGLLAAGLSTLIGMQAWIIMAGNINLIPLTGITLPFVSYGGSSMLVSCIMVGLLLHVSANAD
ncbi:MAG TPA: FtsW/RodA/SpoVE family cell cycle protein [Anaerolineae bacterium]|nr:FtsW/RodA/SpoVE family cell cycle protein [Anaerolineae bacterium]